MSTLTSTHLLCGGGGDARAFADAGYTPIYGANHMSICVETMRANFPGVFDVADVTQLAMAGLPPSDVLVASVICTEIARTGGRKRSRRHDDGDGKGRFDLTRATAYAVLSAVEANDYAFTLTENVPEFVTDWVLFPWWLEAMRRLGRKVVVVTANAAHLSGDDNLAAPAWRERSYIITCRDDIEMPDFSPRPLAWCSGCRKDVQSWQRWDREGLDGNAGFYRKNYRYVCPGHLCGQVVEPYTRAAADAFDLSDLGERIAEKSKHPVPATVARLQASLHYLNTDAMRRMPGLCRRPDGRRLAVVEWRKNCDGASAHEPLSTITAQGRHHGIVAAPEGWRPGMRLDVNDVTYRAIRPREQAAALRFPPSHIMLGNLTQQTSLAGNAVAVNAARHFADRIKAVLT